MPWFASAEVSGEWGWHWTFGKQNPEEKHPDGRRKIASHDYPIIGPYDSSDPHTLECQVLQMKLAGIDGVIIDWYGVSALYDYPSLHKNTQLLVSWLEKAGLQYAICYEDQTVGAIAEKRKLSISEATEYGRSDMNWLAEHLFKNDGYVRVNGSPLLLVFGPQFFTKGLKAITNEISKPNKPHFYLLPHLREKAEGEGFFAWPPVNEGGDISPAQWKAKLRKLYARGTEGESVIGTAFPSFRDYYKTAGVQEGYGRIDHRDGATLKESLDLATKASPHIVQLTTWNDHGEGTAIEPTRESGYRYLEIIQEHTSAPYKATDLPLPAQLYRARKQAAKSGADGDHLEKISDLLFNAETNQAAELLTTGD